MRFYSRRGKRILDVIIAGFALVVLSPALLLISAAIYLFLGRPFFFRQLRPGLNGRPFTIFKFRTMKGTSDGDGRLLPDGVRLTRMGKLLRATSLDELPELWNVVRGEMSLVGPRPLLMEYLERYSAQQARRHEVLPGITGWAQVHGRNNLSWNEKFRLDVWYVDNIAWTLDMKIVGRTLCQVLKRDGINQPGEATAAPFKG